MAGSQRHARWVMSRRSASKLTALVARVASSSSSSPAGGVASSPSGFNRAAAALLAGAPARRGAPGSSPWGAVGGATRAVSFGALVAPRGGFAQQPHGLHHHRRGIFIQTQTTPNPASLMFMPGKPVYEEGGTKNFANPREGMASPLAKKLFLIDGVTSVFFGQDFVTVTKSEDHEWGTLKPEVFAAIMDFYASGEPIITDEAELANAGTAITEDDDEIVAMIKELLETRIRPAVAEDGGDIVFKGWNADTGVVTVKMGSVRRVPELQRHAQERHREHAAALRPGGEQRGAGGGGRGGDGFAGHGDHEPIGGGDGRACKSTLIRLFTSLSCVVILLDFFVSLGAGLREDQVHAHQRLEPGTPFANIVKMRRANISSQFSSMLRVLRFKCAECRQIAFR